MRTELLDLSCSMPVRSQIASCCPNPSAGLLVLELLDDLEVQIGKEET
jgi:hypothetical protein